VNVADFLQQLQACPVIASVQASEGSPVDHPYTLLRLAQASAQEGVHILRLQGAETIRLIKRETGLPVIGLIKRAYEGSEIYITPTRAEVDELISTGCEIIALDGTPRPRPNGDTLQDLVKKIHAAGRLAMADCDSLESLQHAEAAGADILSTTLAGYTSARPQTQGPDLDLLRIAASKFKQPILAEGRFNNPQQVQTALRIGAAGVVIGGALNDPVKQTRAFVSAAPHVTEPVGAVDIGGTWIRFGLFSPDWKLLESERAELPTGREERLNWIKLQVAKHKVKRLGVSTGGVVDPQTCTVTEAKPLIPDHVGTDFRSLAETVVALNDGLATAWGHACLPEFAGRRVATLALGTGVGAGFCADGKLFTDSRGDYPRLNDLATTTGETYEDLLGGAALTPAPGDDTKAKAQQALSLALQTLYALYLPDSIILCGGVGLADWLNLSDNVARTPFGEDAGLYGAAAMALFPPSY
jgi:putative N-acetylmannosamine-6-phosphate epimerase